MDVVAAVKDDRRGDSREQGGPARRLRAQPVGDEREKQNQADAEDNGREPEPVLAEGVEVLRRARQPVDEEVA